MYVFANMYSNILYHKKLENISLTEKILTKVESRKFFGKFLKFLLLLCLEFFIYEKMESIRRTLYGILEEGLGYPPILVSLDSDANSQRYR